MKVSEAIRLGLKYAPIQAFGGMRPTMDSACAIGTAVLGANGAATRFTDISALVYNKCPACGPTCNSVWEFSKLYGVVIHLNDNVRWSRERIADWLESIGE